MEHRKMFSIVRNGEGTALSVNLNLLQLLLVTVVAMGTLAGMAWKVHTAFVYPQILEWTAPRYVSRTEWVSYIEAQKNSLSLQEAQMSVVVQRVEWLYQNEIRKGRAARDGG